MCFLSTAFPNAHGPPPPPPYFLTSPLLAIVLNMNLSNRFCLPPFFFVSFRSRTLQLCKIDTLIPFVWSDIELKLCWVLLFGSLSFRKWNPSALQFHNKTTTNHSCTLLVALRSLSFFSFYKSLHDQCQTVVRVTVRTICLSIVFFRTMYNTTIIRFGFCKYPV